MIIKGKRGMVLKKKVLTFGAVAVFTLSGAFFSETVQAQPTLQDIGKERQEIKSKLSKAESEIADVLFEIKEINEELTQLNKELEDNQAQLKNIEEKMDEYEKEIEIINKRIDERNEILKNRISSYQDSGGSIRYLEVFLGARDFTEFISRISAVTTIANADAELIEEQEKDKLAVEEKLSQQEDLHNDLKEMQQEIEVKKEEQNKVKEEMQKKESELKDKKANLQSEDSDLAALEREIRREMETYTPSTPAVASSNTSSESNSGGSDKPEATGNPTPTVNGGSAISAGMSVLGTPYRPAGKGPGGFDCSGFVSWAYGQAGKSIPSYTGALKGIGTKVSTSNMQPGDLVFFDTVGSNTHVGIYVGGGNFIASNTTNGVEVKSLSGPYWKNTFKGHVRRIN